MKYTDSEFRKLSNCIYYESTWTNDFHQLLNNYKYELRRYIYSYDDDDSNILYISNIKELKEIYYILKSNCIQPKHNLFKLDNKVYQP